MSRPRSRATSQAVRILEHATVYIDGIGHEPGSTLSLPAEDARLLIEQGLAEPVDERAVETQG